MIKHCYNCMNLIVKTEVSGPNEVPERDRKPFFAIKCKKNNLIKFSKNTVRVLSSLKTELHHNHFAETCEDFDVHDESLTKQELQEELSLLPDSKFDKWLGTSAKNVYKKERKE